MNKRVWMAAVCSVALISAAFAGSPVGKWKGKISASIPKLPESATAEQKKQVADGMAMIAKMVIEMDVKADKTYTVNITGGPQSQPPQKGNWSQKGNVVIFTSQKNQSGQKMNLSNDGKTMKASMGSGAQGASVTFTRA
jgi:hypothetical protein